MGRKKRLQKKIKSWMDGYIDFSNLEFEGYSYIKSTYRKDFASALITPQNIEIIENLIPLFNQKESLFTRITRLAFDRKGKDADLESSFLLRLYSNGFTNAFKNIDNKIKKLIYPSVEDIQQVIQFHINELEDRSDCPTENSKGSTPFFDYLLDVGEQEGAIVRGLLYREERETNQEIILKTESSNEKQKVGRKSTEKSLKDMFTISVQSKEQLISKIEKCITINNSALGLTYLKIALEELNYCYVEDVTTFHKALSEYLKEKKIKIVGVRGVQTKYRELTQFVYGTGKLAKDLEQNRKMIDELKQILSD